MKFRAIFIPKQGNQAFIMMVEAQPTPKGYGAPEWMQMYADGKSVRYHFAGVKRNGVVYREAV